MSGGYSAENYGGEGSQEVHPAQTSGPHAQQRVSVAFRAYRKGAMCRIVLVLASFGIKIVNGCEYPSYRSRG